MRCLLECEARTLAGACVCRNRIGTQPGSPGPAAAASSETVGGVMGTRTQPRRVGWARYKVVGPRQSVTFCFNFYHSNI